MLKDRTLEGIITGLLFAGFFLAYRAESQSVYAVGVGLGSLGVAIALRRLHKIIKGA